MATLEQIKAKAIETLKDLKIYKPYIDKFKKDGTVTMFETKLGVGYYMNEDYGFDDEEALKELARLQNKGYVVYAVLHNIYQCGECYAYLYITEEHIDGEYEIIDDSGYGSYYADAYVFNKTEPMFSEYGQIDIQPTIGGGLYRVN